MKKRGEITVFLSLTLVCILSLFMGLLESARTAGARLYLTMAANSAMASVMSQYNRNLWDMYHLLFLEYESPEAIGRSFDMYLDFYLENLYPMKRKSREVTAILNMQDHAGKPLEDGILSYVRYRLPDIAGVPVAQPPTHRPPPSGCGGGRSGAASGTAGRRITAMRFRGTTTAPRRT